LKTLNDPSEFVDWDRYPVCKLLTIYIARELAKLASDPVVLSLTNPGMARTDLDREMVARGVGTATKCLQYALGRSAWNASKVLLHPLVVDEPQAAYFVNGQVSECAHSFLWERRS
jgi:hypothetical protein